MAEITGNIDLGQWLSTMYSDYQAKSAKKDEMFGKGIGAIESYADIFKPGGAYGQGIEAMLDRGEKKAVAGGMQNLVSAGLANTTMPMHLGQTFQEEIGMPTRMRAEDTRMERLGGALGTMGQMYGSYDPVSPSGYGISNMATGGFSSLMSGRIADMQAQQDMRDSVAANQAGLASTRMFGGGASGGGSSRGVPNPYDIDKTTSYGGGIRGEGAGGITMPVFGGHRAGETAEQTYADKMRMYNERMALLQQPQKTGPVTSQPSVFNTPEQNEAMQSFPNPYNLSFL